MFTIGTAIVARNDDWGENLVQRAAYCLNTMTHEMDQVVFVDWNSQGTTLIEVLKPQLIRTGKLYCVTVTPEQHTYLTKGDPDAEPCNEALGRNVGLRNLQTDFMVSTNIDIIPPRKSAVEAFNPSPRTFYTVSRRPIAMHEFPHIPPTDPEALLAYVDTMWRHRQGQPRAGAFDGDRWALIGNCGDWQMAHRDVWYGIRGFDQNLIYRGYADGNVQVKADKMGWGLQASWDFPVMHIHHGPAKVSMKHNSVDEAMRNVTSTRNNESWGFPDFPFVIEVL